MTIRRPNAASPPTLKQAALAAGCSLSLSALLVSLAGAAGRTPPPCAVDGVCIPNAEVWGVYRTNWRPWPGERVRPTPTPADAEKKKETLKENLGDFALPAPSEEGEIEPEASKEKPVAPGGNKPAQPNAGKNNEENPAGAEPDAMEQGPAAPVPGNDAGLLPGSDPFDAAPPPQGAAPALRTRRSTVSGRAVSERAAPRAAQRHGRQSSAEGLAPKEPDSDAPPTLPASLLRLTHRGGSGKLSVAPTSPPMVYGNRDVATASAETPAGEQSSAGIRLINPAAALAVEPGASGLQPAIYYEATDATATDAEAAR